MLGDAESLGSQTEFAMFKRLRVNEAMKKKRGVQCTSQHANCHGKEERKAGGKHTDRHTGRHADGLQLRIDIGHIPSMIQVM